MHIAKIDFSKAGQGYMLRHLQQFLEDDDVSEILINKPKEVYIEKFGEIIVVRFFRTGI
ncbi:hypothetical protein fh0823_24330 [Francisella halioticida]|uniref:hypothetical protein n=1 Tax=Francisella halioticida TaxID=549298 RepID=UPI001AF23B17|nr:hypothetical protein [Francisella halioticida]BCD92294.1 hypothetical protein fh0823_24330 [Francisella halioticida]